MTERLPAHLEASLVIRRAEAEGGFATVLRKGDADRGSLVLIVLERGRFVGSLERALGPDFAYRWTFTKHAGSDGSADLDQFVAARARFDADLWLIEVDIADSERFVAETID